MAVRPFRELLLGLFFISVGMLLDVRLLYQPVPAGLGASAVAADRQGVLVATGHPPVRRQHLQGGAHQRGAGRWRRVRRGAGDDHAARTMRSCPCRDHPAAAGRDGAEHGGQPAADPLQPPHRALAARRARAAGERASNARRLPKSRSPGASMWCCADSAASARTSRACWNRRASSIWPWTLTRLASGWRDRPAMPVIFGDSADEDVLRQVGVDVASAVIVTFANPAVSVGIVRSVRRPARRRAGAGAHPG